MNARIEKKKYKKLYEQATRLLNQRMAAELYRDSFTPEIKTIKFKKLVPYREIAMRPGTAIEMDLAKELCDFLMVHDCIKYKVENSSIMDAQEFTAWLHIAIYPDER